MLMLNLDSLIDQKVDALRENERIFSVTAWRISQQRVSGCDWIFTGIEILVLTQTTA
jgi:hypothetical protein